MIKANIKIILNVGSFNIILLFKCSKKYVNEHSSDNTIYM